MPQVLKFLYSGDIIFENESVVDVLQIADQYDIRDLKYFCESYMLENVYYDTCVIYYQAAQLYNVRDLRRKCEKFIVRNIRRILKHDSLLELSEDNWRYLLTNDDLQVEEQEVGLSIFIKLRGEG